jgi:succinyl-diaminopimelate desuccinylase
MSIIELCKQLIACPSLTPDDAGSHDLIAAQLLKLNFKVELLKFADVSNLWAKIGTQSPVILFAGHSDVVATGELQQWHVPPFSPAIVDGYLYGRGAVDMKGGLAAMLGAVSQFLLAKPSFVGTIAFLITSDEEGSAINGTAQAIAALKERGEVIDYCIVGEPSSESTVGDQIRIGRRGSMHGTLTIYGEQHHIAYPKHGQNPIHSCLAALADLTADNTWDDASGPTLFPPTSYQISHINAGTGSLNVIPAQLKLNFNLRFGDQVTPQQLQERVQKILAVHQLKYELSWELSSMPWLSKPAKLAAIAQEVSYALTKQYARLSTGGGTSDGRFLCATGAEIIELGLCYATAHQINECVKLSDLFTLQAIYHGILAKLL